MNFDQAMDALRATPGSSVTLIFRRRTPKTVAPLPVAPHVNSVAAVPTPAPAAAIVRQASYKEESDRCTRAIKIAFASRDLGARIRMLVKKHILGTEQRIKVFLSLDEDEMPFYIDDIIEELDLCPTPATPTKSLERVAVALDEVKIAAEEKEKNEEPPAVTEPAASPAVQAEAAL